MRSRSLIRKMLFCGRRNAVVGILCLISMSLACVPADPAASLKASTSNPVSQVTFAGAKSAVNLDGTRIKITWDAAEGEFVFYRIYEIQPDGTLTAIVSLPKTALFYTHANLTPGSLHSYMVRTVASDNTTDGNINAVTAMTYAGLTSFTAVGLNTVTANFPSAPAATNINIYCSARGGEYELTKTVEPMLTSTSLSLKSGTSYRCKALAESPYGRDDDNTTTKSFQTVPLTQDAYKNVSMVKALGEVSDASWTPPEGQVNTRQVTITWKAFTGATSSTVYRLVRVSQGESIDTTTTTVCTSAASSSCLVCTSTGSGEKSCTDANVAAYPAKYDYAVVLVNDGWPEELPSSDDSAYRITIPIPPANMVLVHRATANDEMCTLMSKTDMDPLNHQRCAYTGLGGTGTHFDLGRSLFVDRWETGCNYSRAPACGVNGCIGLGVPDGALGAINDVYYNRASGVCYIKTAAATWTDTGSAALTAAQRIKLASNAPNLPPIVVVNQSRSWDTCVAFGRRLPSHREQLLFGAWSPALDDTAIGNIENGTSLPMTGYCNTNSASGLTYDANVIPATLDTLPGSAASGLKSVRTGSSSTRNCVSRYGVQDFVGNVWEWSSDQLGTCSSATHTCSGITSYLDQANSDWNGFEFNGNAGPGGGGVAVTEWNFETVATFGTGQFLVPLGLPLVTSAASGYGGMTIGSSAGQFNPSKFHGDRIWLQTDFTNGSSVARGAIAGGYWVHGFADGRFALTLSYTPSSTNGTFGFRCVSPAD